MKKIIFDRSIFHKDKFEALRESKLSQNLQSKKLKLFYTPRLLEETLAFAHFNKSLTQKHWNFLVSLNSIYWFRDPWDIVELELYSNSNQPEYYFRPFEEIQQLIENSQEFFNNNDLDNDFQNTLKEIQQNKQDREDYKKVIYTKSKDTHYNENEFDSFVESKIQKGFIRDLLKRDDISNHYMETWEKIKLQDKFAHTYIKAKLAVEFLRLSNHNIAMDVNDRLDAEQLAYLIWADIFVSDDRKFMKKCFEFLYARKNKRFMSSSEFLTFIN